MKLAFLVAACSGLLAAQDLAADLPGYNLGRLRGMYLTERHDPPLTYMD